MNYCKSCPLKDKNVQCIKIGSININPQDFKQITARNIPGRCQLDSHVVKHLSNNNKTAKTLAERTLEKSLINNDSSLLVALLTHASQSMLGLFWQILKNNETRSLKLINPLFISSGSRPLNNINLTKNSIIKYMKTITRSPISGDI